MGLPFSQTSPANYSPPSGSPPGGSGGPPGGFGSPPGGFGRGPGGVAPPSRGAGWRPSPTISTPQSLPSGGTTPIPTPGASGYSSAPAPALAPPPFRPSAPVSPNWSLPTPAGAPLSAGGAVGTGGAAVGGASAVAVGAAAGLGLALGELGRGELAALGYEGFEYPPNTGEQLSSPLSTLGAGLRGTLESLRDGFEPFELAGAPSPTPLPMPGGAAPFSGGQSPGVAYRIRYGFRDHMRFNPGGTVVEAPQQPVLSGPIRGFVLSGVGWDGNPFQALGISHGAGVTTYNVQSSNSWLTAPFFISIVRVDGQPDTGGDPQPAPSIEPARPPRTLPFPVPDSPLSPGVSPAPAPHPSPASEPAPSRLPVPAEPDPAPIAPPLRETPQTPGLPSTPYQPATPRVPSIPELPTVPELPQLPQTPFSPFGPQRIGNPVLPGTAAQPGAEPIPAAPGVGTRTQLPPVTVTTLNPTAGGELVKPPTVNPPATTSNQRPNDPCQDPCGDGIFGAIGSLADLLSSIIDALAGNNEQNCDVCALLEQAIALLEPEGNNTVKLYPCDVEVPETPAPGQPDPAGTTSLAWSGTGIQALIEASKATQKGIAEIWEKVKCEAEKPVVIYPSDVYSEFTLESRLLLEFTKVDEYPKRSSNSSKWSLEIANPRTDLDWAEDFENFRFTKGQWYGRVLWSNSGVRSGAYCSTHEEALRLCEMIKALSTSQPQRTRTSLSGAASLYGGEVRVIRAVRTTILNNEVTECVEYHAPTTSQ
jgi:hypothetical protein